MRSYEGKPATTKIKKGGQPLFGAGTVLVVFGAASLLVGLFSFLLLLPPCPINACPSIFSSYYAVSWSLTLAGLVMIILGVGLILEARKVRNSLAKQHSTAATSSSPTPV